MKRVFTISACFILLSGELFAQQSWQQVANFGGGARYSTAFFSINGKGYVCLGNDGSGKNDLWEYDPAANSWTQKVNFIGVARWAAPCFSIGNSGYVGCGNAPGASATKTFYEYNAVLNTWIQRASIPGSHRQDAVGFAVNGKGYITCGWNGNYLNDLWQYDPNTDTWSQRVNFPGNARAGLGAFAIGSYGYAGIGEFATSTNYQDFYKYDPALNVWTSIANFPGAARNSAASLADAAYGYVGARYNSSTYYNDFWRYDPVSDSWNSIAAFPVMRTYMASFALNNSLYVGTGRDNSLQFQNDFYKLDSLGNDTCIFLKPGPSDGKDAHVLSGLPTFNAEPHPEFLAVTGTCGGNPCTDRQLVYFDLTAIPQGSVVVNATMDLFANPTPATWTTATFGSANTCLLQRITTYWDENLVTWNNQPNTTSFNQVTLPQSTSAFQDYLNINVTNLVQDMVNNPASSFGFMLLLQVENYYNGMIFASSDYSNAALHPSLNVCFNFPASVQEINQSVSGLEVFPNPFDDEILFGFTTLKPGNLKVSLNDLIGKTIATNDYKISSGGNQQLIFNLRNVPDNISNGIYFFNLEFEGNILSKKVIKSLE